MLQTIYQRLLEKSLFSKSNINIMTANTYFTPQMFPTKYPASYTYVKKIARVATEWTKLLYWFAILSILGHNCRMGLQLDAFFLCAVRFQTTGCTQIYADTCNRGKLDFVCKNLYLTTALVYQIPCKSILRFKTLI